MHLQESGEMYLESILVLSRTNTHVRAIDVCEYMGYSKPSVSRAIGLLKDGGYVTADKNGYLELTDAGVEAAEKIYEILLDQYKPKSEDENQDQEKQGDSSETDDQNKSEDQTEGTGNSENNQQGNPDNQKKSSKNKDRQSGGNSSRGASSRTNGSQENADNEADAAKRLMDDFDDIKNELENLATEPKQGLQDKELASGFNKERKELARECEGKLERGSEKDRIIIKVPENKGAYEDSLQRVRRYIPTVSNILKSNGTEYKTSLRGLRSGMMDPCKIAEAFQGVPSIYMRESKVKADRMTVSLLIDESGSMDGEKIIAARDTAILFREALKNVANISLYVYGYTSDGKKTILCKYIEPGYAPKYSMGSMDSRRGTPTAEAISETVKRITLNKEEQALMIVISDGYPNSSNEEVAAQVKNAERKGIKVMGISIDDDLPESALKKMYGKYIKYSDMGSLVSSLSKVLKKEVLENTQKKYSA